MSQQPGTPPQDTPATGAPRPVDAPGPTGPATSDGHISGGSAPYISGGSPALYVSGDHGLEYQSPSTYAGLEGSNPPSPPLRPYGSTGPTTEHPKPAGLKRSQFHLGTTFGLVGLGVNVVLIAIVVVMLLRWPSSPPSSESSPSAQAGASAQTRTPASKSPSSAPASPQAPTRTVVQGGPTTVATAGFSITPPPGWGYRPGFSSARDIKLVDARYNKLTVTYWKSTESPVTYCDKQARATAIWTEATIKTLPQTPFKTGEPFPGFMLEGKTAVHQMRCLARNGYVYNIISESRPADAEAVAQAFAHLIDSWTWG